MFHVKQSLCCLSLHANIAGPWAPKEFCVCLLSIGISIIDTLLSIIVLSADNVDYGNTNPHPHSLTHVASVLTNEFISLAPVVSFGNADQ